MTTPALQISTRRLDLIAATALLARADASDRVRFSEILGAEIPQAWPPAVMADVMEYFAEQLEKGFAVPGWWSWYGVLRRDGGRPVLIGNAGLSGRPDSEGSVTLGYSVIKDHEGAGYATEMVAGLIAMAGGLGPGKARAGDDLRTPYRFGPCPGKERLQLERHKLRGCRGNGCRQARPGPAYAVCAINLIPAV